jgi:hypothetical protein
LNIKPGLLPSSLIKILLKSILKTNQTNTTIIPEIINRKIFSYNLVLLKLYFTTYQIPKPVAANKVIEITDSETATAQETCKVK